MQRCVHSLPPNLRFVVVVGCCCCPCCCPCRLCCFCCPVLFRTVTVRYEKLLSLVALSPSHPYRCCRQVRPSCLLPICPTPGLAVSSFAFFLTRSMRSLTGLLTLSYLISSGEQETSLLLMSVCLSVCLPICLSVSLIFIIICLAVSLSLSLSHHLFFITIMVDAMQINC